MNSTTIEKRILNNSMNIIDKETFTYWVSHPHDLAPSDLPRLESTAKAFPYCQVLYYLIAKASSQVQPFKLSEAIPKAAVYALDRKALRNLIETTEPELQPEEKISQIASPAPVEQLEATESVANVEAKRVVAKAAPIEKESPRPELETSRKLVPRPLSTYSSEGLARQIAMIQLEDKVFNNAEQPPAESGVIFDDQLLKEKEITEDLVRKEKVRTTPSISMDSTPTISSAGSEKQLQQNIIERFIQSDPRIGSIRVSSNELSESLDLTERLQASTTNDGFATESFAILFARQGKIDKAIGVYEKLILKNPKKKDYFAQKINELRS